MAKRGGPPRKRGSGARPSKARGRGGRRPGPGQRGTTRARPESEAGSKRGIGGDHVEGRHAVRELLAAGTRRTREVLLASGLDQASVVEDIVELARDQNVPVRELGRGKFEAMARTDAPQGVIALAAPLPTVDLDDLVRPSAGLRPFLLVLDGVTDPGNVGAILRTAECAGVTGVVFPRHRAARIAPTATKAAAGAIEHLRLCTVPGVPNALATMREAGIWVVGLDEGGDQAIHDITVGDDPIAVVMGAEGAGISRLVRERCDLLARIPMRGVVPSLNVGAAAAVTLFEIARRR